MPRPRHRSDRRRRRGGSSPASSTCARERLRSSPGRGSTSSRSCRPTTSCARSGTRWGSAAASRTCPGCSPARLSGCIVLNVPFAWLVKRLPRVRFIPIVYRFFTANIVLFAVGLYLASGETAVWIGRMFFVWLSVFNLFVVSIFWQTIVDVFTSEQGKRLFGFIAAGATIGAIAGSAATATLARNVPDLGLLLGAAALLELAVFAVRHLSRLSDSLGAVARRSEGRSGRSAEGSWPASRTRCARPTCSTSACFSCSIRHLDVPVFPAGRRQPGLPGPRRADRVLRERRSSGQRADPRHPALSHRPHRAAARASASRLRACRSSASSGSGCSHSPQRSRL